MNLNYYNQIKSVIRTEIMRFQNKFLNKCCLELQTVLSFFFHLHNGINQIDRWHLFCWVCAKLYMKMIYSHVWYNNPELWLFDCFSKKKIFLWKRWCTCSDFFITFSYWVIMQRDTCYACRQSNLDDPLLSASVKIGTTSSRDLKIVNQIPVDFIM